MEMHCGCVIQTSWVAGLDARLPELPTTRPVLTNSDHLVRDHCLNHSPISISYWL